ncbi:MAG TPA: PDR/VanB family oxidoreductase, partial [Hydrogenophaga sp.]|nr:PDR/VanB family oxidoreductase [Hydrogenophaga sp.]
MNLGTLRVRVARKSIEALDICSFELADIADRPLPAFAAGSHIDVHLGPGLVRQYSLCNNPAETDRYLIGVLLDPLSRGGSRAMHALDVGDELDISMPKNHFALVHQAQRSLLLAGGIGITPILCMAERLANVSAEFEMHYCTRSRERTAFAERIERSSFAAQVGFHFDDGPQLQRFDIAARLAQPMKGEHLYVCGPKGFMEAVLGMARQQGWPEDQLHFEFFSAAPANGADDASFEVQLASSGKVIRVGKDQTVVQALANAGVDVPTSCEQGVCG